MTNKYDAAAQQEWRHKVTDWETRRADEATPLIKLSVSVIADEATPLIKLSVSVIAVAIIGLYVLDHIAMEISRW